MAHFTCEVVYRGIFQKNLAARICRGIVLSSRKAGRWGIAFGRYGDKRITGLLQMAGWNVNAKRVQRIWRREGLKVPKRQPKRGRLWLNDGSCIRLRPEHRNHVWAYDFVAEKTDDGRPLKLLTVVDEYARECLAIVVARRLTSHEVLMTLAVLFLSVRRPRAHQE